MTEAEQRRQTACLRTKTLRTGNCPTGTARQSVYPFLLDGSLDPVFRKKAQKDNKTFDEIKAYYRTGYATDVEAIGIENNVMEFHKGKGQPLSV